MKRRLIENLALRYQGLMLMLFPRVTIKALAKGVAESMKRGV